MTISKKGLNSQIQKEVSSSSDLTVSSSKKKKKSYVMDLRVHTPASVGYFGIEGIDTAPAMVSLAKVKKLDVIAVTDFYSGGFIDSVIAAAKGSSLTVIPGVNLRCTLGVCNDVILTCLFPESFTGRDVEAFLRNINVPVEASGRKEYIVSKPLQQIVSIIESSNGVVMPSRMDQTPHRLSAIPALINEFGFRTFDLAYPDSAQYFKKNWPKVKFNLFSFSNANSLAQLGTRTARVKMPEAGFDGVKAMTSRVAV
ncbi:MAG: hypothetical protein SGJ02_00830 [bacterium]|nr:hypothetical protein [bacterium]